ncbi:YfaZ precursor [Marinospirillum celere]|uniref:YfaZ n=1 Tax=Marinospirillum celere TaxID=1122252 RepID=A0A1I1IAV9_9GAMM|nr:YfaZ family outer membrane protein [Marinospirillum celere]SFC33131.1 YfaZ precursor [Marinospirillum celere]
MSVNKSLFSTVAAAALLFSAQASAFSLAPGSLEANLNNESIQFEYDRAVTGAQNLHINGSILYTEQHSDDSASVFTVGFQGVETDNRTFRAAVGARLYGYTAPESTSGLALAFGGLFYHIVPGASHISLGGYGWVAPQVTSFGDTEYLYEAGARIAYRVIQNTDVFLGYRYLHLKSDDKDFNDPIEDGFHLGFRLNF